MKFFGGLSQQQQTPSDQYGAPNVFKAPFTSLKQSAQANIQQLSAATLSRPVNVTSPASMGGQVGAIPSGAAAMLDPPSPGGSSYRKPNTLQKQRKSEDHIAQFRSYLSDLLKETDEFQSENEHLKETIAKLKSQMIYLQKDKLLLCFDHSKNVLKSFAFGEWKHVAFENWRQKVAREMQQRAQDLIDESQARVRELEQLRQDEHQKYKNDLAIREDALIASEEESAKKNAQLADMKMKLAKIDKFLQTVAEQSSAVHELAASARSELDDEEVLQKGRHVAIVCQDSEGKNVNRDNASEFVKDSLHDLLAKVDHRYMPRMIKNPMSPSNRAVVPDEIPPVHTTLLESTHLREIERSNDGTGTSSQTLKNTTFDNQRYAQRSFGLPVTPRVATPVGVARPQVLRTGFTSSLGLGGQFRSGTPGAERPHA